MSSTIQILIADDEDKMRRLVGDFLKREAVYRIGGKRRRTGR